MTRIIWDVASRHKKRSLIRHTLKLNWEVTVHIGCGIVSGNLMSLGIINEEYKREKQEFMVLLIDEFIRF